VEVAKMATDGIDALYGMAVPMPPQVRTYLPMGAGVGAYGLKGTT
jgi:hypothetical protein